MSRPIIPPKLMQQIRGGRVIPFVGAGISHGVRNRITGVELFPDWPGLLERAANRAKEEGIKAASLIAAHLEQDTHTDFLKAADYAKDALKGDWSQLLKEEFDKSETDADPASLQVARSIWQLANQMVITTNYDHVLEWVAPVETKRWLIQSRAEMYDFISDSLGNNVLWHLHGTVDDRDNTVLTQTDYDNLYGKNNAYAAVREVLQQASSRFTFLFIGCSLRDIQIMQILDTTNNIFNGHVQSHYAVMRREEAKAEYSPCLRIIGIDNYEDDLPWLIDRLIQAKHGESRDSACRISTRHPQPSTVGVSPSQQKSEFLAGSLSIRDLYTEYVVPELTSLDRARSTLSELVRSVGRWEEWEQTKTALNISNNVDLGFIPVSAIHNRHLRAFQRWLQNKFHSNSRANTSVSAVLRTLRVAEDCGLIEEAPRSPPRLPVPKKDLKKTILEEHDVKRLWEAVEDLKWPNRDEQLRPATWEVADFWRAALVMWLTYGMNTQELVSLEHRYKAITWSDIHFSKRGANKARFSYIPQKQKRLKSSPVRLPLTRTAEAALKRIRPAVIDPAKRVFYSALSSKSFYEEIDKLVQVAGISKVGRQLPRVCRDTAKHYLEEHYPGISDHVLGLAPERSLDTIAFYRKGRPVPLSEALDACFANYAPFECFNELLD